MLPDCSGCPRKQAGCGECRREEAARAPREVLRVAAGGSGLAPATSPPPAALDSLFLPPIRLWSRNWEAGSIADWSSLHLQGHRGPSPLAHLLTTPSLCLLGLTPHQGSHGATLPASSLVHQPAGLPPASPRGCLPQPRLRTPMMSHTWSMKPWPSPCPRL